MKTMESGKGKNIQNHAPYATQLRNKSELVHSEKERVCRVTNTPLTGINARYKIPFYVTLFMK